MQMLQGFCLYDLVMYVRVLFARVTGYKFVCLFTNDCCLINMVSAFIVKTKDYLCSFFAPYCYDFSTSLLGSSVSSMSFGTVQYKFS